MAIYIKIDGIPGPVETTGYSECVQAHSGSFGISRTATMEVGKINNRVEGFPYISTFDFSKNADQSSIKLFKHSLSAEVISEVTISMAEAGNSGDAKAISPVEYVLKNVIVSGYDVSLDGSSTDPVESISFSFTEVTSKFNLLNSENSVVDSVAGIYDLKTGSLS